MNTISLLVTAGIVVTIGDLVLAQWARSHQILFLIIGLLLNLIGIFAYANALQSEQIGIATALFLGFNILAVTLGGILIFSDRISILRAVSLFFLFCSIIFVEVIR